MANNFDKASDKLVSEFVNIGTANASVDADKHQCFIVGTLLGRTEAVKPLRTNFRPNFTIRTVENARDIKIMAQSLRNFNDAAEQAEAA